MCMHGSYFLVQQIIIIVQLQHLVASLAFTMHTVWTSTHNVTRNLYLFIYRAMVHIYIEYSEIVCTAECDGILY